MVPRWAYFMVAFMISINVLLIGFGLVDIDSSPLSQNSQLNITNTNINDYSPGSEVSPDIDTNSIAGVSTNDSGEVKFGLGQIIKVTGTLISIVGNMLTGYTIIFALLNFPPILTYLFTSIITLIMIIVIIDILSVVISSVRGLIPR